MAQRIEKLMTMYTALHWRDGINKLYLSRKEGARGLASIEYKDSNYIYEDSNYIYKESNYIYKESNYIYKESKVAVV